MDDLVAFLNARLDEDEALIREVRSAGGQAARDGREAAAKRAILARYEERPASLGDSLQQGQERMGLLYAIEALAAVYSDHPDYHQEWKPEVTG